MRLITLSLCAGLLAAPAFAQEQENTAPSKETTTLSILELQTELKALKAENSRLRSLLNIVSKHQTGTCSTKLQGLQQQKAKYLKAGLTTRHPDMVNLNKTIQETAEHCTAPQLIEEQTSLTCISTLGELKAKKSRMEDLGFKKRHPDMINLSKEIEQAKIECQKTS